MTDETTTQATGTQVARKSEFDTVKALLDKMKPEFEHALPKHLTVDRFMRIVLTSIRNTPKLLECDRRSFFAAVMTSAQLGLEPDGVTGQAYLVPFAGTVTFIPGYRGLISLARNSGELMEISAHEVYENDHFEYSYGFENNIVHRPPVKGDRGALIGFYACAKFNPPKGSPPGTDGGRVFEYMTLEQVEAVRDASQGYKAFKHGKIKTNPWATAFVEMGRKTLIRRIAKYLPLSVQKAAIFDEIAERGGSAHLEGGEIVVDNETGEILSEGENVKEEARKEKPEDGGAAKAGEKLDAVAKGRGKKKDKEEPAGTEGGAGTGPETTAKPQATSPAATAEAKKEEPKQQAPQPTPTPTPKVEPKADAGGDGLFGDE